MASSDPSKPTRTDIDAPLDREDAEQAARTKSHDIPGRSFAGVSFAADQQEQTAARRDETRAHLSDDTVAEPMEQDEGRAPRDES